jgi:hypothetical protein
MPNCMSGMGPQLYLFIWMPTKRYRKHSIELLHPVWDIFVKLALNLGHKFYSESIGGHNSYIYKNLLLVFTGFDVKIHTNPFLPLKQLL